MTTMIGTVTRASTLFLISKINKIGLNRSNILLQLQLSSTTNNIKLRILVVDDEPDILLAISSVLASRGHYVKTFNRAILVFEHLQNEAPQYDLLITDYRMPGGISGLELAKTVKKYARKTKVFLMTAFDISALPEVSDVLKSKIVDEILQKPIPNDKLIDLVEKSFLHNNH